MLFRYSRWDGSQQLADLDADDLLAAMSDDLMSDGDLWNALRRMFQRGLENPQGPQVPGLQNLLDRLRKRRQEQLDRYDLGSALEDIKKKLDEVVRTERAGIENQVKDPADRAKKLEPLDQLPPDPAGRIKQLQDYNFTDPEAERLEAEMAQLAMHLDQLGLTEEFRRRYDFRGDDDVTMREAMKLMDELQQMEELERQLRRVQSPDDLDKVDPVDVQKLLGDESAQDLERLKELAKKLEEAGYLERKGDRLELTARAIRKLGDKALKDIFAHLKRDRFGRHAVERRGAGGDPTDEAKRYEFGDPFLLDLKKTLMNAVERNGAGTPVRLSPDDFEVIRTELSTQASTVVMLDMSRSMINNGYFLPAKKVTLALTALIRGQFPRDSLYILGFPLYARQ